MNRVRDLVQGHFLHWSGLINSLLIYIACLVWLLQVGVVIVDVVVINRVLDRVLDLFTERVDLTVDMVAVEGAAAIEVSHRHGVELDRLAECCDRGSNCCSCVEEDSHGM